MTDSPTGQRTVKCVKLQRDLPGLDEPPWPGELGQRIYENVSVEAWGLWEERMKMVLNEYRLMPWQKEAQTMMAQQMEDFFSARDPHYHPTMFPLKPSSDYSPVSAVMRMSRSILNVSAAYDSRTALITSEGF